MIGIIFHTLILSRGAAYKSASSKDDDDFSSAASTFFAFLSSSAMDDADLRLFRKFTAVANFRYF